MSNDHHLSPGKFDFILRENQRLNIEVEEYHQQVEALRKSFALMCHPTVDKPHLFAIESLHKEVQFLQKQNRRYRKDIQRLEAQVLTFQQMSQQSQYNLHSFSKEMNAKFHKLLKKLHQATDSSKQNFCSPSLQALSHNQQIQCLLLQLDKQNDLLLKEKQRNLALARLLCEKQQKQEKQQGVTILQDMLQQKMIVRDSDDSSQDEKGYSKTNHDLEISQSLPPLDMSKVMNVQKRIIDRMNAKSQPSNKSADYVKLKEDNKTMKQNLMRCYLQINQLQSESKKLRRILEEFNERYLRIQNSYAKITQGQARDQDNQVLASTASARWPINQAAKDVMLQSDKIMSLALGQLRFKHQTQSKEV